MYRTYRVFIRQQRSANPPATTKNSPATTKNSLVKFRWPELVLNSDMEHFQNILLLLYTILLLLQFLLKTLYISLPLKPTKTCLTLMITSATVVEM